MKAEVLMEALRELRARGWPVEVWGPREGEYGAEVIYPDGGYAYPNHLQENGFQFRRDSDILTGWLVSQLEARGLRRSINQYVNGTLDIYLQEREGGVVCTSRPHTEEIDALIEVCLVLPAEADRGTDES
jgi:hypothetical protein